MLYVNGLSISSAYLDGSYRVEKDFTDDDSFIHDYFWIVVEFVGVMTSLLFYVSTKENILMTLSSYYILQ